MPHPYRHLRAELPAAPVRRSVSGDLAAALLAVAALSLLRCACAWVAGEASLGEPVAAAAVALLALAGALRCSLGGRAR